MIWRCFPVPFFQLDIEIFQVFSLFCPKPAFFLRLKVPSFPITWHPSKNSAAMRPQASKKSPTWKEGKQLPTTNGLTWWKKSQGQPPWMVLKLRHFSWNIYHINWLAGMLSNSRFLVNYDGNGKRTRIEDVPSLKLTCSHLKMDDWKTIVSFWDGNFSGAMLVSGSVFHIKKMENFQLPC